MILVHCPMYAALSELLLIIEAVSGVAVELIILKWESKNGY